MSDFIDANVVLRYLIGDSAAHLERAKRLLDGDTPLVLTETALLETAYTLSRHYGVPRAEVADRLIEFVQKGNITVHHLSKDVVITALLRCRASGRVSFGDALIWAAARHASPSTVYSFDRRFPSDGIDLREPE